MLIRTMISVLTLGLAASSALAARTFCCDDHGRRVCGDVLPEACVSKAYSEFNERGVRGPNHNAPLTAAQEAVRDAELKKKRDTEKLALDQRRRDQALLATYATEADLDNARDRAVAEIERNIKQVQDKLDRALVEQKKLGAERATYRTTGEEIPQDFRERVSVNDLAVKTQQDALVVKQKNIEQTRAKFEVDRGRLRELRGANKPGDEPTAKN